MPCKITTRFVSSLQLDVYPLTYKNQRACLRGYVLPIREGHVFTCRPDPEKGWYCPDRYCLKEFTLPRSVGKHLQRFHVEFPLQSEAEVKARIHLLGILSPQDDRDTATDQLYRHHWRKPVPCPHRGSDRRLFYETLSCPCNQQRLRGRRVGSRSGLPGRTKGN